jgi:hypothetical protein
MAFVPGRSHDLFLSYARADDPAWIDGFAAALRSGLRERLGQDVSLWQDVDRVRLGENWHVSLERAIDDTAAFLAIVSPIYLRSTWCQRERRRFLEHTGTDDAAARAQRFLKIIKSPSDDGAERALLPHIQDLSFFRSSDTGDSVGFVPGSEEFRLKLREAVHAIASLLRSMRRRHQAVFIATPAEDGLVEWEELRRELQAQGFDVRPEGPLDPSFADPPIVDALSPAVIAVFLLTGSHDPFLTRQLDLARQHAKRLVFWVHPNATTASPQAAMVIESIRQGERLPADSALLDRMSSRDMIREVLEILKPRRTPQPLARGDKARVYLLYDPTTERDGQAAMRVRDAVRAEHLELFVPQAGALSAADRLERHRQLLRECDGVLVCRHAAPPPDQWLFQMVPDVLFAEKTLDRPPMQSKAFLLGEPDAFRGLPNVIPLTETVAAPHLEPFLQPLRRSGAASAV